MPSIFSVALGSLIILWVSMVFLCAPLLASTSCKQLLDRGPTASRVGNYLVGVGLVTAGHIVLIFLGSLVNQLVPVDTGVWFVGVTLLYPAACWSTASVLAPHVGWWDPTTAGIDGRLILGLLTIWYVIWTFVLAALFVFAWFLAFYPG